MRNDLAWLLAAALALALGCSCNGESGNGEPPSGTTHPAPPDPPPAPASLTEWEELGALWRKAAGEPQAMSDEDKLLFESLFVPILPQVEGAEWQVVTVVGNTTSQLRADLMKAGRQIVALDAQYHLEVPAYGTDEFQGHPAAIRNQFVFVLFGHAELRLEGTHPDWKATDTVKALLARFPLERIAEL